MTDPTPTDLEIAQATLPVSIHVGTQTQCDDGGTGTDKIKRCSRQDQAETGQGIRITNFTGFQLKTGRFIVKEVFLSASVVKVP